MGKRPVTIFLSAAEASGDEHASRLVLALKRRLPDARFIGVAGPKMAEAGCEVVEDLSARASMMLGGPLFRLRYYLKAIHRIQDKMREVAPDVHIPVDSPALNWHLAATAKELRVPVMYYIAPQVWAWAPWRVKKLARLTDLVACILPFEQRYLRDRGVNAVYVGHPLFESLPARPAVLPDLAEAWSQGAWRVALLPGSRPAEISHHSRALLAAAKRIRRRWSDSRCTFAARNEESAEQIRRACRTDDVDIVVGRMRELLAESHFAVAVSGTATMEVAYFGVPMVIVYRASRLLGLMHKAAGTWGVPIRHLSLVNILAGRRIVPELMPWHGSTDQVVDMVMELMDDLGCLFETRTALLNLLDPIRAAMKQPASDAAAELVCDLLHRRGAL